MNRSFTRSAAAATSCGYRELLPNGVVVTLQGWPDIDQIDIPGMRGAAFGALEIVRQKIITTDRFRL